MSLLETALFGLVSPYDGGIDRQVARRKLNGATAIALQDTNLMLSPTTQQYITSVSNSDVFIPVLNNKPDDALILKSKTCEILEDENTSSLVQVQRLGLGFNLTMNPAQYGVGAYPDIRSENYMTYAGDFQRKLFTRIESMARTIEEILIDEIDVNRNTFWDADTLSLLTETADALDIPVAELDRFYNYVMTAMGNMYLGMDSMQYNVIHNPNHSRTVSHYANQGLQNGVNTAYQYGGGNASPTMPIGNFNFAVSNYVTNDLNRTGTAYVIPRASLALLNVNDVDNRMGSVATDGTTWSEQFIPELGMNIGVRHYSGCGDASIAPYAGNVSGNTASLIERWQFFTQIMVITPYNPTPLTNHSPIVKFAENTI